MQEDFNVCKTWFRSWHSPSGSFMELMWSLQSKCFFFLHHLYRGMCFCLSLSMNKVHADNMLPLTWEAHNTGGAADTPLPWENKKGWLISNCKAAPRILLETWNAPDAINWCNSLLREATATHSWFTTALSSAFTTVYHDLSPVEKQWVFF